MYIMFAHTFACEMFFKSVLARHMVAAVFADPLVICSDFSKNKLMRAHAYPLAI